jgi:hypothetical protein
MLARLATLSVLVIMSLNACKHTQTGASGMKSNMTANMEEVLWPNPTAIPICWEPVTDNQRRSINSYEGVSAEVIDSFKEKVRKAATSEFGKARIGFVGWKECLVNSAGMRILLGGASAQTRGFGRVLDGVYAGIIISDPAAASEYALQGALHEIGHALGLRHEASRYEGHQGCAEYAIEGGEPNSFSIGPYDPNSLMNYCVYQTADKNNQDSIAKLSKGDVDSLVNIYRGTVAELREPLPYMVAAESTDLRVKNVESYRVKIGPFDSTSCQSQEEYSEIKSVEDTFQLTSSKEQTVRVCIRGSRGGVWQDLSAASEYVTQMVRSEVFAGYRTDKFDFSQDPRVFVIDPRHTKGEIASLAIKVGSAKDDEDTATKAIDCLKDEGYKAIPYANRISVPLNASNAFLQKLCIRASGKVKGTDPASRANEIIIVKSPRKDTELLFLEERMDQSGNSVLQSSDPELTLILNASFVGLQETIKFSFGSGQTCNEEWKEQRIAEPLRLSHKLYPEGPVTLCARFKLESGLWEKEPSFKKSWNWVKIPKAL